MRRDESYREAYTEALFWRLRQPAWRWWMWPWKRRCPGCRLVKGHPLQPPWDTARFGRLKHEGGSFRGVRVER